MSCSTTTKLSNRRLLVTGATGFIGARLCEQALASGATVHAVSRRLPAAPSVRTELHWEQADLTDASAVETLVQRVRPDFIVHLASEVTGAQGRDLVLPMLQANFLAAVNVMLAASSAGGCRVVLAGSMEELDPGSTEELPPSPYAAAKSGVHAYTKLFHTLYELPVVHLRISMVYGPGQQDTRKLVPYVITSLLSGEAPKLTSGTRAIDWVYIDDVVDAFLDAAVTPGADGRSFEIGSGIPVDIHTIAVQLQRLVGSTIEPLFGSIPDRKLEGARIADLRDADGVLGWRPHTGLDRGLAQTVDYYRGRQTTRP